MSERKTESAGKMAAKPPVDFDAVAARILDEPAYAKKLHGLVKRARKGDQKAAQAFQKEFFVPQKVLDRLNISKTEKDFNSLARCTFLTPHFMVDFIATARKTK